ncbi:MAG: peptidoglycan-binding protein [Clostridia bacterium]|nr:peptidoglycan-binding protein [Clostridia bacterium]
MNHSTNLSCIRRICALTLTILLIPTWGQAATGTVNCKSLILRKSASKSSKAIQSLDKGDKLNIISSTGDWYKVTYGRYTGYVMKDYVTAKGTVKEESSKATAAPSSASASSDSDMKGIDSIADLGGAPATTRPGDKGANVKKLQQALKLEGFYTGKIDGSYGSGTKAAVKKFQKKHGLSQDGIAGKVTIKLLFGENASNAQTKTYKTQQLNWFNGGSGKIPKGATFTVKDVKTGKTFTCKRWSGSNHLDAEPLTKSDAATMKSIYGGSWSWDRRAILVKYGDNVYAASMNGMPHGTQTITDNGFNGHFCIHFYKSRTHESNKVDAAHQNAVSTAMRYTW